MLHIFINPNYGDDVANRQLVIDNIYTYLSDMYATWSSRTLIFSVFVVIYQVPVIVWQVADAVIFALLPVAISILTDSLKNTRLNWCICGLVFLYTFRDMSTAGWIATTITYIWPVVAGLFALLPVKHMFEGKRTPVWMLIVSVFLFAFAASNEMVCGVLFGFTAVFTVYALIKKKADFRCYASLLICALMLLTHLLCPGNSVRSAIEATEIFSGFNELGLMQKLNIGFVSTMQNLTLRPNFLFMLLAILLAYISFKNNNGIILNIISIVPVLIIGIFGFGLFDNVFSRILETASDAKWADMIMDLDGAITTHGVKLSSSDPRGLIALGVFFVTLLCMAISTYFAFKDRKYSFLALLSLAAGFASRMVMSFSPTVWVSGTRTFFVFYVCIIYCCTLLIKELVKDGRKRTFSSVLFTIFALISFISQFAYVIVDRLN